MKRPFSTTLMLVLVCIGLSACSPEQDAAPDDGQSMDASRTSVRQARPSLSPNASASEMEAPVRTTRRLRGIVRNLQDARVSDARVEIIAYNKFDFSPSMESVLLGTTTSDSQGCFDFTADIPGEQVPCVARVSTPDSLGVELFYLDTKEVISVTPMPKEYLFGAVTAPDGNPVEGAEVYAVVMEGAPWIYLDHPETVTRTLPDGTFRLPFVPSGLGPWNMGVAGSCQGRRLCSSRLWPLAAFGR